MAQNTFGEMIKVEFDSMINVRPSQGNMTRGIEDEDKRTKIMEVVHQ